MQALNNSKMMRMRTTAPGLKQRQVAANPHPNRVVKTAVVNKEQLAGKAVPDDDACIPSCPRTLVPRPRLAVVE